MAAAVYILCAITSSACAALLLREHDRRPTRLLLWSGVSFVGFAISNALVFADLVAFPDVDLSLVRALTATASIAILLYGLTWDAD